MLYETKCAVGDKVFIVYGDPRKNIIVLSGIINKVCIFTGNNIMYNFCEAKIEVDKEKRLVGKDFVRFGFFYEKDLDKGNSIRSGIGLSDFPVFTTKEKCINYLRRVTK